MSLTINTIPRYKGFISSEAQLQDSAITDNGTTITLGRNVQIIGEILGLTGNISIWTNDSGYITLASLSSGAGINYNSGVITNSAPFVDATSDSHYYGRHALGWSNLDNVYYPLATNPSGYLVNSTGDARYLGISAQAADSAQLQGHNAAYFYQATNPSGYLKSSDIGSVVQAYNSNLTSINQTLTTSSNPNFLNLSSNNITASGNFYGTTGYLSASGIFQNISTKSITASGDITSTGNVSSNSVNFVVASSAGTYRGNTLVLTSAETQAPGDAVQINTSGKAHLAKADAIYNANCVALSAASVTGSATNTYLLPGGTIRLPSSPSWLVGSGIYLSASGTTGNTLTQVEPSGSNNAIQSLGIALTNDTILFLPSLVIAEHI